MVERLPPVIGQPSQKLSTCSRQVRLREAQQLPSVNAVFLLRGALGRLFAACPAFSKRGSSLLPIHHLSGFTQGLLRKCKIIGAAYRTQKKSDFKNFFSPKYFWGCPDSWAQGPYRVTGNNSRRPYCIEHAGSHPNSVAKRCKAGSVLGWGTAREHHGVDGFFQVHTGYPDSWVRLGQVASLIKGRYGVSR